MTWRAVSARPHQHRALGEPLAGAVRVLRLLRVDAAAAAAAAAVEGEELEALGAAHHQAPVHGVERGHVGVGAPERLLGDERASEGAADRGVGRGFPSVDRHGVAAHVEFETKVGKRFIIL